MTATIARWISCAARGTGRLLAAVFKDYEGFSIRDVPPVRSKEKDERFLEFLASVLEQEEFDALVDYYEGRRVTSLPRKTKKLLAEQREKNNEEEKQKRRILDKLRTPANLNAILQIYFA